MGNSPATVTSKGFNRGSVLCPIFLITPQTWPPRTNTEEDKLVGKFWPPHQPSIYLPAGNETSPGLLRGCFDFGCFTHQTLRLWGGIKNKNPTKLLLCLKSVLAVLAPHRYNTQPLKLQSNLRPPEREQLRLLHSNT